MKQFFKKTMIFCSIVAVLLSIIHLGVAPSFRNYDVFLAVTIDKEKRLAQTPSPRWVLVGGSNWVFGVDSRKLQDSLHLPVVNMGLYAGTGLQFMLNETQAGLRAGDTVLLSSEYYVYLPCAMRLRNELIDVNPAAAAYAPNSISDRVGAYFFNTQRYFSAIFLQFLPKNQLEDVYARHGFSPEGDNLAHLGKAGKKPLDSREVMKQRDYSLEIAAINQFIAEAKAKKAVVYYLFPTYVQSEYQKNKAAIDFFAQQMTTQLHCPILNTPETFVFPDEDYFDTVYHLNAEGRKKRTEKLIAILRN